MLSNPVGDRYQVDRCSIDLTCEVVWAQDILPDDPAVPGDEPDRVWLIDQP